MNYYTIIKLLNVTNSTIKGKPPAEPDYVGPDAEIYLTPEYLRGKAGPAFVKPAVNSIRIKSGETIVLWDGSNAGEIFRSREGILSSTMARINFDDEFRPEYFYYALKRWEEYLKYQTSGSGIPHVDKEILGNLQLFLYSLPEQSKIAEVLSTIDRAIEQTEALIAKQQRIKTGLMQDLLTRGIDENGKIRSEETHQFKDSPLGMIPVEWEVKLLGNIAQVSSGLTLGKTHSGPNTVELPYLRVANVQDGFLDLSEIKIIRVPTFFIDKYELKVGDVLMNEGGDFDKLGRGTVWQGEISKCLHQNHVFKVRPMKNELDSKYLSIVSSSPYGKSFFVLSSKQSTNLASINSTQLKSFPIPLPNLQEQMNIVEIISQNENKTNLLHSRLSKLHSLKTALMQDLLTGNVRVTPLLEEETVSV